LGTNQKENFQCEQALRDAIVMLHDKWRTGKANDEVTDKTLFIIASKLSEAQLEGIDNETIKDYVKSQVKFIY
jgi:hypothetical protein